MSKGINTETESMAKTPADPGTHPMSPLNFPFAVCEQNPTITHHLKFYKKLQ